MESSELILLLRIHLSDGRAVLPNGSVLSISDLSVGDTIEITEILTPQDCVRGKLIRSNNQKPATSNNDTTSHSTPTPTKTTTPPTERPVNHPRAPSASSQVRASLPEDTRRNNWLSVRPVSEETKANNGRDRTFTTRTTTTPTKDSAPSPETGRSFLSSKSATNIQSMARNSGVPSLKKETIRVWFKDGSFKTVAIIQETTCEEVIERITKRIPSIGMNQNASSHFVLSEVSPDGTTRVLKPKDTPATIQSAWKDKTLCKFVLGLHPRTIRRLSVQIHRGESLSDVFTEEKNAPGKSKTDSFMSDELDDDGLDVLLKSLRETAQKKQEDKQTQQQASWVRSATTEKTGSRLVLGHTDTTASASNGHTDGTSPSGASPASQAEQDVDEPDNDDFTEALYSPVQWFENEITSLSELVKSLPDNVLQNIQ